MELEPNKRIKTGRGAVSSAENNNSIYKSIFESFQVPTIIVGHDFTISMINPEFIRVTGYSKDELMGLSLLELIDMETPDKLNEFRRTSFQSDLGLETFQTTLKTYNKYSIIFELKFAPIQGTNKLIVTFMDITQFKIAENTFKNEKNLLTTLTENAPVGLVLMGSDGSYNYVNPKFKEIFGYDLEDIPHGRDWFKKAYPDPTYRYQAIKTWVDDFKTSAVGEKRPRTFTVTCKDGTNKEIYFIPVSLATGEQLMTLEDITQRVGAEKALKASEERFRTLAQSAVDSIVITDIKDRIVFCNESLQEIFGYSEEEIMGSPLEILMPDKFQTEIKRYEDDDLPARLMESYGLRKDGSEFPVEISVTSWAVEKEKFTTYIIRDITDRKLIEYKLKMREEMFTEMAEHIDEVFWVIDPLMNQIQYVSPTYERVWGRSVTSLYKNPESWLDSIHPEDREMVVRNMFIVSRRIQRRRMDALEYRIRQPDGTVRWIKSRVFPIINEDKKTYRIVGIALDITRRRTMEEMVRELKKPTSNER